MSDGELAAFLGGVTGVAWGARGPVPQPISDAAASFSSANPKPTPAEFRGQVSHAATVISGWDKPDAAVLHTALKAYYVLAWMDYLAARGDPGQRLPACAYQVAFTPTYQRAAAPDNREHESAGREPRTLPLPTPDEPSRPREEIPVGGGVEPWFGGAPAAGGPG